MPVTPRSKRVQQVDAATARQMIAETVSEKDFQQQVILKARACGWLVYHTWNSRNSEAGFPDLTLVRGDRLAFAELKREKNSEVREPQQKWLNALGATGKCEMYVWRPSQWAEIEKELSNA